MANYLPTTRTNYFRVTDEKKYQELFKHLASKDNIEDSTEEENGVLYHGFEVYGSADYRASLMDELDFDFDYFLKELQKILPEDEAFIYQEAGHESLSDVTGYAVVVTSKEIKDITLSSWVEKTVEELLGKDNKVKNCLY